MKPTGIESRPIVSIAGASGFVGSFVRSELREKFRFRGLTRSPTVATGEIDSSDTDWRHCDLFSLPKVTEALEGSDYALYLVHSMSPSSRLVQASFADLDLLLADNFIRAAEAAKVRRVIYLGGLLPQSGEGLSPHLRSRLEVEKILRSRSTPVTALRAGLIFGPGGSSFSMLIRLVQRLPIMVLPRWVRSRTQSIDILDVVKAVQIALDDDRFAGGVYDLGGHQPMSYRELILETARLLGRKVRYVDFPLNAFALSRRWVSVFGGIPPSLSGPLLESLSHDLQADPNPLLDRITPEAVPFSESLTRSVDENGWPRDNPRKEVIRKDRSVIRRAKKVRSVQRLPLPDGWTAPQVSEEYGRWLTKRFRGLLSVVAHSDGVITFEWSVPNCCLLELKPSPYTSGASDRTVFTLSGGMLVKRTSPPGRLEFRIFPREGYCVAAVHGFAPRLPWWVYTHTQAYVHLWVMRRFGRHLGRK